jgi:hypothetical protein
LRSIGVTLLLVVLGGLAMIVGAYLLIGQVVDVTDAAITPAQRFTAAFATATALGALTALVLNIRKQDLAEQLARREITAAFTERFRSAAAQLGGQSPAERLAGVYAMAALADEYPSRRQQCVDVLCGYLRLPYDPATDTIATTTTSTTTETGDGPVTTQTTAAARPFDREVRATIITVVREHTHPNASPSWSQLNFNLRGSHLADVDLRHSAFLGRIVFQSATFTGDTTFFNDATFTGDRTSFNDATFTSGRTNFTRATFTSGRTNFTRATFTGNRTSFTRATFAGDLTYFTGAVFTGNRTDFSGASFVGNTISFNDSTFTQVRAAFDRVDDEQANRISWDGAVAEDGASVTRDGRPFGPSAGS